MTRRLYPVSQHGKVLLMPPLPAQSCWEDVVVVVVVCWVDFGVFVSAFSGVGRLTLTSSILLVVSSSTEQLWVYLASEFKEKDVFNPTWQSTKESQFCKVLHFTSG